MLLALFNSEDIVFCSDVRLDNSDNLRNEGNSEDQDLVELIVLVVLVGERGSHVQADLLIQGEGLLVLLADLYSLLRKGKVLGVVNNLF